MGINLSVVECGLVSFWQFSCLTTNGHSSAEPDEVELFTDSLSFISLKIRSLAEFDRVG